MLTPDKERLNLVEGCSLVTVKSKGPLHSKPEHPCRCDATRESVKLGVHLETVPLAGSSDRPLSLNTFNVIFYHQPGLRKDSGKGGRFGLSSHKDATVCAKSY